MIRRNLSLPGALILCLAWGSTTRAQTTYTWNGSAGPLWNTAGNWTSSGPTPPPTNTTPTGTLLVLAGTTQLTNTLDYDLGVNSLTFDATAGSFVVNGTNLLTLGSGGITIANNNGQTINAPIVLAATQTWTNNSTGTAPLTVGSIATGGSNLTVTGAGRFAFNQPLTGGGSLTKSGAGVLTLTQNNANTSLNLTQGTIAVAPAAPANNPLGTGTVTLSGGTLSFRGPATTPILLTPASFNADVIASVSEQGLAAGGTTFLGTSAPVDNADFNYFEAGRTGSAAGSGLPSNGTLVSLSNPNQTFQLQGYGTAALANNNARRITGNGNGTLTLQTGASFSQLVLATTGGSGTSTMSVTLNFTSGSPTVVTGLGIPDWFNGANPVIQGIFRINRNTGAYDNAANNPRIYANSIPLSAADAARTLTSVQINQTAGAVLNIFGLSGAPGTASLVQNYTNGVVVTGSSTIDITDLTSVTIGSLSLGNTLAFTAGTSATPASPALFTAGAVTLTANSQLNYPNTIAVTLGQFSDGGTARTFTKNGTGLFTIANSGGTTTPLNLAAGSTFVAGNGNVNLNVANSITTTAAGTATLTVSNGTTTLPISNAFSSTTGAVTLNVTGGTAALSASNALASAASQINFNPSGGTTTLTAAGALTTTGRTIITQTGGTVNANAANVFGNTSTTINGNGGTLNIAAGNNYAIGSLGSAASTTAAGQTINLNGTTLTINGTDGVSSTPFRGRILNGSAAGAVVVTGGTTTFGTASPYTGGLTVSGGKVVANMPGTLGNGTVNVGNGTVVLTGVPGVAAVNGFTESLFTRNGGMGTFVNDGLGATSQSIVTTTATTNQARSAYHNQRIPVASNFTVSFRYSQTNTTDPANGVTITIQGVGPGQVGGNGTNFGASGANPGFTLGMNVQEVAGGVNPGVNGFQNGNIAATFFNPPSPGFPDVLQAGPAGTLQIFVDLSYNAATGTFTGRYGQRSPANPGGGIIYIPLSDAQAPIDNAAVGGGVFNGVIPAANMAYNLVNNIGGGAFIGITGSTNNTAAQNTQQVIDQFVVRTGLFTDAANANPIPAALTYNQAFSITGGTNATVNVLSLAGATSLTGGALTIGAGTTGLTVGAETGSVPDGAYGLTFGATTLSGNPTFTVNNNGAGVGTLTLGALNDGAVARTITKAGAGTLVLGGAGTLAATGTQVIVSAGTLNLNNATAIGGTAQLTVNGTLNANAGFTVASLAGSGAVNLGANAVIVGTAQNLSSTFAGTIAGTGGSLTKAGTGTLTLSGSNTYTGSTTVSAGVLSLSNAAGAQTGTGLTNVAAAGTLMGTGRIGGGLLLEGNLSPGNSVGTLSANAGTTTFAPAGKFTVEYIPGATLNPGTTIDSFNSLGSLNITATNVAGQTFVIDLKNLGGGTSPATTNVSIVSFAGGITGFAADKFTFTGDFAAGAPILALSGNGQEIVLTFTPVPEPATVLGLAAGALGLAGLVRRRSARVAA